MNQNTSFWNFKDKKVYTKASEKLADFLFGVFAPTLFIFGLYFVFDCPIWVFGPLFSLCYILIALHFFERRRFIFYGMMTSVIIMLHPFFAGDPSGFFRYIYTGHHSIFSFGKACLLM